VTWSSTALSIWLATGALPDQLVEAELVAVEVGADVLRRAEQVGRADRLVRLLGVLGLGGVDARLAGR
jgi:hypothetical protein